MHNAHLMIGSLQPILVKRADLKLVIIRESYIPSGAERWASSSAAINTEQDEIEIS